MPVRVPYVTNKESTSEKYHEYYDYIVETRGSITDIYAVLLNSPEVAGRVAKLGAYLRFDCQLSERIRELIIITTAREMSCEYEWAIHEPLAREKGLESDIINSIIKREEISDDYEREKNVIKYVRHAVNMDHVSNSVYQKLENYYSDQQIIELATIVGYYTMLSFVVKTVQLQPEENITINL